MELHDRFLQTSTVDISLLRTVNSKCESDVYKRHLIHSYNYEMIKEKLNMRKLELCKLLLCHEYQSTFDNIKNSDCKKYMIPADPVIPYLPDMGVVFPLNCSRSNLQVMLLCDIIILQMILYYNPRSVRQYLQNFLYLSDDYIVNSDYRDTYMKLLEYLLAFLRLYKHHTAGSEESEELQCLSHIYVKIIKSWMKIKNDSEWRRFVLLLPKLINTFTPKYIVFPLWDYILHEISDLKESFTALSIMADVCLTPSDSMGYIHSDIYCKSTFWLLILKGLRSSSQQYRKQALYVMKKAIDSISQDIILKFRQSNLTKDPITPFICSTGTSLLIDHTKKKFFLLYEALQEKQDHLVIPALTHIAALIRVNKEHKICNCFDIVWLQCIFEKILLHENNRIAKWGVLYVCTKLDNTIFNDQFLELFVGVLNNNFLYECQYDEECPGIVRELSEFLRCAEKSDLLNRFLQKINQVAWGPVAIFYIIHALRTISHEGIRHSNWQATELNAIKSLVETNLSMHSHILRTASQIELLRTIPNYVQQIDDLPLLANVLSTFPSGEGLTRGTAPWDIITAWLQKVLAKEDAITFMEETCAKYLHGNANPEMNPKTFAILVYLLYDANLIFSCKTCPSAKALNNWLGTLNGISARPYVDIPSSVNAVEFVSHLLHFSTKGPSNNMTDFISLYIHTTFNFLIKNIKRMSIELTYEDYTRCTAIVSSHIVNASFFMSNKDANGYAERLQSDSIRLIDELRYNLNIQYLYGLHILHLSQNALFLPLAKAFYTEHLLNTHNMLNVPNDININLKGKIMTEYHVLFLKITHQYLVNTPVSSWIPIAMLLSNLIQLLQVGLPETVSEIARILTVIIDNKVISDISDRGTLEFAFNLGFMCIIESKKNNIFWTGMQNLMGVIINNNFLRLPNSVQSAKEYIIKLLNEGKNTPRFRRILLSKMRNLDVYNMMKLDSPLAECLLHGSVYRRDKKIENHVHLFIVKHLGQYYPKHMFALDHNNDAAIRAEAVVLLHRIISNTDLNYAATFVRFTLDLLEKSKIARYFNDSSCHKSKHRLMQVLLVLEPVLNKELVLLLQEKLCDFIFLESNQSSVKLMLEWLMIRTFTKNIDLHDKLWSLFAKSIKHRPSCTISVASIVYHVAKLLSNDNQRTFIQTALPYIVQCCLGQQFGARVYNQFILTQLFELMRTTYGDDSVSEYKGIYQATVVGLQQETLTKNSARIQDDFYFSNFHPTNDYSLQTIYYELPRLTNVSCDEWISPDVFKDLMFKQNDDHPLQLYNANSFLSETKSSVYLAKSVAGNARAKSLGNAVEINAEGLCDIQKKIDPSKSVNLYNLQTMGEIFLKDMRTREGLIVVASFVDRPPNLGGIARTCEIFGVKSLVVANADCVRDKEFQYLSVSADKWLNMIQVKPHELQIFLFDKKNTGWSLIGAEQTVNSVNLMTTKFEKKTVLVLGNEKDGIPPNLIPLFDNCIEIPQVGVTRSLNVHVTAAICIWQYASQHMLTK